jgi:hypothetical protein
LPNVQEIPHLTLAGAGGFGQQPVLERPLIPP